MSKISKGVLKLGALVVLVALVMIIAIPASANGPTSSHPTPALHTLQGSVVSITNTSDTGSFVIQSGDQQVTIVTNTSTKYYLVNMGRAQSYVNNKVNQDKRGGFTSSSRSAILKGFHIPANWRDNLGWLDTFNTQASFSDIQVGDRVVVRATNDGNNVASQILITKPPVIRTVKGTVNSVTQNPGVNPIVSITPNGSTTALALNVTSSTRIVLKGIAIIQQGQSVVAVYNSTNNNAATINIQAAP